jgi:hypothetical protein
MNPNSFDLTDASRVYAVSNTPLFLVRKLQADPVVRAIADTLSGEEIVQALRAAVATEPQDVEAAVLPYVYIVALWYKPEMEHLLEAAATPAPHQSWFPYIASALIQTFSPVLKQLMSVPGQLDSPTVFTGSSSEPTRITINYHN